MLTEAKRRLDPQKNVEWVRADALETLRGQSGLDVVFSSWVLGYIPFAPFLEAAVHALVPGGRLAFVVHRQNSPREPLEIFWEIVAADPSVLTKRVYFDFPRDAAHVREELACVGLEPVDVSEESVNFHYATAKEAFDHLLKSGAGTAFYDALDPDRRPVLEEKFLQRLTGGTVTHDYVACLAIKPSEAATSGG
jgi:SAM-dependent methyltransferase